MASTEASRRDSVASSSEMSFADSGTTANKLLQKKESKKEKPTGGIKLKKSLAKKTKPKDTESNGTNTAGGTRDPSPSSPTVASSTSKTEGDRPVTSKCKHCAKPVQNAHFESHLKHCQEQKQEQKKVDQKKARDARKAKDAKAKAKEAEEGKGDGDSVTGDRSANGTDKPDAVNGEASATTSSKKPPTKKSAPSAAKTDGPTKKTKKRKADDADGADKEPKKKKAKKADTNASKDSTAAAGTPNPNDPPKPKMPKPKGPVNVELQCGVALPNGAFCARSLTCKSHSMGAKRSVPGRSAPYDQLLQQYQKKNQAKQQKALLANQAVENAEDGAGEGDGGAVDSEEEKDAVMAAIKRGWGGRPFAQYHHVGSRRRYEAVRRREMVRAVLQAPARFATHGINAAGGGSGSVVGGGVTQSPANGTGGEGDDLASRKASMAAALSGKPSGGQRKPSLGGAGASAGGA